VSIQNALSGPNPFNPNNESTHIQYQLSQDSDLSISIYALNGKPVWTKCLSSGDLGAQAGFNSVLWNGQDERGRILANGPYIAYIVATNSHGKAVAKIKILVLK
jgi:flagellar hook assembly protein FlgD